MNIQSTAAPSILVIVGLSGAKPQKGLRQLSSLIQIHWLGGLIRGFIMKKEWLPKPTISIIHNRKVVKDFQRRRVIVERVAPITQEQATLLGLSQLCGIKTDGPKITINWEPERVFVPSPEERESNPVLLKRSSVDMALVEEGAVLHGVAKPHRTYEEWVSQDEVYDPFSEHIAPGCRLCRVHDKDFDHLSYTKQLNEKDEGLFTRELDRVNGHYILGKNGELKPAPKNADEKKKKSKERINLEELAASLGDLL